MHHPWKMLDNTTSILPDLSDKDSEMISPERFSSKYNQDDKIENSYLRCKSYLMAREMSSPLIQWNEKYQKIGMAYFFGTLPLC